ncbi:DUF1481 domain-containing protein [Xenorhabdus szentirmaii]|uniref:DUF1481 domain-containing protein n=2 Tax=Xenorhabdus szentirmaii TaxID=290112 RepID=W1IYS3_9GAMM|nr:MULTISPECIES: DUF1481 domain-containing protein [Xenorhabdus]PHM43554.1 hypothetical protein Xszus_03349 [Xenorhabdus szentirmaii]CDL82963.1 conserved hypothetical protein [Xenorhabdus szentirmaii DSM 16338]
MLVLQGLLAVGFISLLSACSTKTTMPLFNASGFVTDGGIVRLWRLDSQNSKPQVIMSVYSPYRNNNTTVTFYEYRHGRLWQIRRDVFVSPSMTETLRFGQNNEVIFKLRKLKTHNELLSDNDVMRLQFDAKQIEKISSALITGHVKLFQGQWHGGKITTCAGAQLSINFEPEAQNWLKERQKNSTRSLTIAWLDSPEGKQLLLVANDDFCRWEPTKDKL